MTDKYLEGDEVTILNLGPSYSEKTFRGVVRGISIEGLARIYIIQMVDQLEPVVYPYSHCTMPEACLKRGWN